MLSPGDRLADRYRIEALAGSGGTATVYRARDERLDRDVAIKLLDERLAADGAVGARFEREARALAAIRDPHVITVHDVVDGSPAHPPFLVLELADGGTLAQRIRSAGALPPTEVASIVEAIAIGLDAIHAAGLVHRDVKPANVLFADGRPRLGDLGVARPAGPSSAATPDDPTVTTDGALVGTLRYVAPEVLEGEAPTAAGDVYGLAATAFEALTGRPLRGATSFAALIEEARSRPPAVSTVAPALGTVYDQPFASALDPSPAVRPSGSAFAAALLALAARDSPDTDGAAPTIVVPVVSPVGSARAASLVTPMVDMSLPGADATPTIVTRPVAAPLPVGPRPANGSEPARETSGLVPRPPATRPRPWWRRPPIVLVLGAAAVVAILVGANALPGLPRIGSGTAPSASLAGAPSSESASAIASASVASPSAPSVDPTADAVIAALDDLGRAIDIARGGNDGLKGKDANDLAGRLDAVKEALAVDDLDRARTAAHDLAARVDKVTDDKRVGDRIRDQLRQAAAALVERLGA